MNETIPSLAKALGQRAAALNDFHAMVAAEALGRILHKKMPGPESVDPSTLPPSLREAAERAKAMPPEAMAQSLERTLAVNLARATLAAAAETPAAQDDLSEALDEAERPSSTLASLNPMWIGAAISVVILVAKLHFVLPVGDGYFAKDPVGDPVLGQCVHLLERIVDEWGR